MSLQKKLRLQKNKIKTQSNSLGFLFTMSFTKKSITKFSIGRFTTGVFTVFGIVVSGTLYGIILSSLSYNFTLFSFMKMEEFDNDEFPNFRKKYYSLRRFFIKRSIKFMVPHMSTCMDELANLPMCALKYKESIKRNNRGVLVEKHSLSTICRDYSKLNKGEEFMIMFLVYKKYGEPFIRGLNLVKPVYTFDFFDTDDDYCIVQIPTFHNKEAFLTIRLSNVLSEICGIFMKQAQRKCGVDRQFELLKNKSK